VRLRSERLTRFAAPPNGAERTGLGIHERLALILHPKNYDRWLGIDGGGGDPRPPTDLLHPYDSDKMKMFPPNPAVGNVDNNGPDMLNEPDELRGR
jgi:putative SOS response-associated peptidase YedK